MNDLFVWRGSHSADFVLADDGSITTTTEDGLTDALRLAMTEHDATLRAIATAPPYVPDDEDEADDDDKPVHRHTMSGSVKVGGGVRGRFTGEDGRQRLIVRPVAETKVERKPHPDDEMTEEAFLAAMTAATIGTD